MSEELEATPTGLGRRQFIKSSAAVGGLVWAAPAMSTFGARAFAGTREELCPCPPDGGQVSDLVWRYDPYLITDDDPAACQTGSQPQAGDVFCTYDEDLFPNGAKVTVKVTGGEGGPGTYTFEDSTEWEKGETEAIPPGGGRAGASQLFQVFDEFGSLIHEVSVHTSCSYSLSIGDRFGAFVLVSGSPGEDDCPPI